MRLNKRTAFVVVFYAPAVVFVVAALAFAPWPVKIVVAGLLAWGAALRWLSS